MDVKIKMLKRSRTFRLPVRQQTGEPVQQRGEPVQQPDQLVQQPVQPVQPAKSVQQPNEREKKDEQKRRRGIKEYGKQESVMSRLAANRED